MSDWQSLIWEVPLESPPIVAATARNAHGFVPMDRYRLPDLWSLHLYGYEANARIDEIAIPIRPGYIGLTPPGATLETHYQGISVHLFVHFALPPGPVRLVRAMQDLGGDYDYTYRRLYAGIEAFAYEPKRTAVSLWDVLWDLAMRPETIAHQDEHPAIRRALSIIDRGLAGTLTVPSIAEEAGVSSGYLVRLFRESLGDTVAGTIRNRRLERAAHLLQRSTLPIKAIAISVGMPDLQHFNKAIRVKYGVGPRELRRIPPNTAFLPIL